MKDQKLIHQDTIGHSFQDDEGNNLIEFHVDDAPNFQELANQKYTFGGTLSVRRPPNEKTIILFGQDECNFNQFTMNSRQWVGPKGERVLNPKSDGSGIMISGLQSREFAYGLKISQNQFDEINLSRRGKKYFDEESALYSCL